MFSILKTIYAINKVLFCGLHLQDKGDIPMAEVQSLTVKVTDVNDQNPVFDQSFYEASIVENATQVRSQ